MSETVLDAALLVRTAKNLEAESQRLMAVAKTQGDESKSYEQSGKLQRLARSLRALSMGQSPR